jgi:hypothetical protein
MENINKDQVTPTKEFDITTTNLAGEFEPAKGKITIHRLKSPLKAFRNRLWEQPDRALYTQDQYYRDFPYDLYADELNKFKWEQQTQVLSQSFDTGVKKTFTIADLSTWSQGEYVLEIVATDKSGKEVNEVSYFTVYSPKEKSIPTPSVNYFQPLKLSVEPGEKASFTAGTSEKKLTVLYEVERDGQILSKEWITLNDEQRLFEIPIREEDRGNLGIHYTFIRNNRLYSVNDVVVVPFTNKMLDISFETFRDKLLPGQEEQWKILIKGKNADKAAAEMVATLYDESLDVFRINSLYANFFNSNYARLQWNSINGFNQRALTVYNNTWNEDHARSLESIYFDSFNWFGYSFYDYYYQRRYRAGRGPVNKSMRKEAAMDMEDAAKPAPAAEMQLAEVVTTNGDAYLHGDVKAEDSVGNVQKAAEDLSQVKARTNFNETAFFYPHLQTNEKGRDHHQVYDTRSVDPMEDVRLRSHEGLKIRPCHQSPRHPERPDGRTQPTEILSGK